jgi:radical SAM protein with 4Fe4S-binding SPASM domain
VIFSGGEPLLRGDLLELMAHAKGLGISPQLSSNGVLVDEAMAARLKQRGVDYVGISVDGMQDFNDDYRGMQGGTEAALRGLRCAKAAGMRTGLRMTLTSRNVAQLPEMVEVAQSVAVDRMYISHLVYSGRGFKVSDEDLTREVARATLTRLFEIAERNLIAEAGTRITTGSNDSDGPFLLRWVEERYGAEAAAPVEALLVQRGGNSAGERILNIDARGRVHPDQFWRAAVLGDVRKQPFAEILEHPMREELRGRVDRLTGRCAECSYKPICRGSHRERALALYRDPWASDPACVMEDSEIGVSLAAQAASGTRESIGKEIA